MDSQFTTSVPWHLRIASAVPGIPSLNSQLNKTAAHYQNGVEMPVERLSAYAFCILVATACRVPSPEVKKRAAAFPFLVRAKVVKPSHQSHRQLRLKLFLRRVWVAVKHHVVSRYSSWLGDYWGPSLVCSFGELWEMRAASRFAIAYSHRLKTSVPDFLPYLLALLVGALLPSGWPRCLCVAFYKHVTSL